MSMLFYLASVVLSLYAAYIFTFKTYDTDYKGKPTKRYVCPNIVYLLVWLLAFAPIVNAILLLFAIVAGLIKIACKDIYIDSWLFKKPDEKQKEQENNS